MALPRSELLFTSFKKIKAFLDNDDAPDARFPARIHFR